MLRIGVFGVGHLGKIHVKCIQMIDSLNLIGFYDPDDNNAAKVIAQYGIKRFSSPKALIEAVDLIDIVTPTLQHFDVAKMAMEYGKHIFIEKPVTSTIEEAEILLDLQQKNNTKVQIGHVERFNPAFLALDRVQLQPMFIEGHRLSTFNVRGTDISVVLDLMIHDLDIVHHLIDSDIKEIHASGVSIVSETSDIANARIEFENGCVANLTASRFSMKQMRKLRLFQSDAYISLDFLEKNAQIIKMHEPQDAPEGKNLMELHTQKGVKMIEIDMPDIEPVNAIKKELEEFSIAVSEDRETAVTLSQGYKVLKTAMRIVNIIESRKKYALANGVKK